MTWGAVAAAGAAGITAPIAWDIATRTPSRAAGADIPPPYGAAFRRPPVLLPYETGTGERGPFAKYTVTETAGRPKVLPGLSTAVYGYNGLFPGPTIAVDRGTWVQLRVRNQLPAVLPLFGHVFETSTHLHGSASLPQYDGYANDVTVVGSYKEYEYPNFQGAHTLWYHDHAVDHTSQNMYSGLLGQYHLYDAFERGQLPRDEFDVRLVLTDALFAGDRSLAFEDQNHAGLYGDVIVVNGVAWPTMKIKRRVYRFRVLAAAASCSYRLHLSSGEPLTIVATDGGLMSVPQAVAEFRQGGAERYEVLIDFGRYAAGTLVDLLNASNPHNDDFAVTDKVMRFGVTDEAFDGANNAIPDRLHVGPGAIETMALTRDQARQTTRLDVERSRAGGWEINDQMWMNVVPATEALRSPGNAVPRTRCTSDRKKPCRSSCALPPARAAVAAATWCTATTWSMRTTT
ncbi:MAG: multicopper oxidase family protein [Mycobacteriales bacterium]